MPSTTALGSPPGSRVLMQVSGLALGVLGTCVHALWRHEVLHSEIWCTACDSAHQGHIGGWWQRVGVPINEKRDRGQGSQVGAACGDVVHVAIGPVRKLGHLLHGGHACELPARQARHAAASWYALR